MQIVRLSVQIIWDISPWNMCQYKTLKNDQPEFKKMLHLFGRCFPTLTGEVQVTFSQDSNERFLHCNFRCLCNSSYSRLQNVLFLWWPNFTPCSKKPQGGFKHWAWMRHALYQESCSSALFILGHLTSKYEPIRWRLDDQIMKAKEKADK